MSWFSNLAETYDKVADLAHIPDDKGNVLLPFNHMAAKTDICVTIDGNGTFRRAEASVKTVVIPCTEDSSARAGSAIMPHPLNDQLGYLELDERKRKAYLSQLLAWSGFHQKAGAVYTYINHGSLINDLYDYGIPVVVDDYDKSGNKKTDKVIKEEQDKITKLFVRFRVEIPEDVSPNLWEDESLVKAWQDYCAVQSTGEYTLCYVTGLVEPITSKHPKGINPSVNGAKLISSNDDTNYTYRGRFSKSIQANAISATASHKAHAMLKYLVATQGYKCDTQAVVAWAIDDGKKLPDPFKDSYGLYMDDIVTDKDKMIAAQGEIAADYAVKFRDLLDSKGRLSGLSNLARRVAIVAIDAATTGRMGITFYQDLLENEYINRLTAWHTSCRWWFYQNKHSYISAPSADSIITAVYGEPKGEGYKKIQKQARERILHFIVCGERIDRGWVSAAVNMVSNPFSYSKVDDKSGGWDKNGWEYAVSVACAIIRKYFIDKREEITLELDKTNTDRSYLFGRLLAIADRLESHARFIQIGNDDTDKRPTNAVRYMSAFAAKPMRSWKVIYSQLNPYIQRLNGADWYQRQIDEIVSLFIQSGFNDAALDGKYLLGYSLQRRELMNKNNDNGNKEEKKDEFNE